MNDESQSIVAEINSSLSIAAKRQNGLFKMINFLENCSSSHECSLLEQNCSFWLRTILQIFENHPVSLHAKLAQYAFYIIIQNSKSLSSDLQRNISTSFIEKSIQFLISPNDLLAKNSLQCLNELISSYKAPCSQFRVKIENFVYAKLESDCDEVLKWASICYAKLPFLHKNTNNIDIWYTYFKNMLQNANSLLNDLLEDYQPIAHVESTDNHDQNINENQLNQSNIPEQKTEIRTFTKLVKDAENLEFYFKRSLKRFKACIFSLGYLFEPLNERVVVKVRYLEILNFLKRLFLFDFKKLANNCRINLESKYLNNIFSEILVSTFEFCEKFFTILNTNLIPHSSIVNNMLVTIGHSIIDNEMTCAFTSYYSCLNSWLTNLGYNSGFYKTSFSIIENLLTKIKPIENNILAIDNKSENAKNRHKQSKMSGLFAQEKYGINTYQVLVQNKLIVCALECLKTYIKNFSFNLSFNQFEKIHSTLIDIILCIQYNTTIRKPYDLSEPRQSLYQALFDLCLSKNPKIAPPLSVSIGLFKNASHDTSREIQLFAKNSLSFLKAFTCPLQLTYLREYNLEAINQNNENLNTTPKINEFVLPSTNGPVKQEIVKESQEMFQFLSKQNHSNGYNLDQNDQNLDQIKHNVNITNNKRKKEYEDEDEDEEENEDQEMEENQVEFNPKNVAKKFQPNGHFQNRNLKPLNSRDVENSNGDDDEEEEEIISLDDEDDEEQEDEDEENAEENEDLDEDEDEEEEEEDVENDDDEDEDDENGESEESEELLEKAEQQIEVETVVCQNEPTVENQDYIEKKTELDSNIEVSDEVKNILKETDGDYEQDEESNNSGKNFLKESNEIYENDGQDISMANLETISAEVLENATEECEQSNKQFTENEMQNEINQNNTEIHDLKKENDLTPVTEQATGDSEEFDDAKFKQMCSSLNVNAMADNN